MKFNKEALLNQLGIKHLKKNSMLPPLFFLNFIAKFDENFFRQLKSKER